MLLFWVGACSSQQDPVPQDETTVNEGRPAPASMSGKTIRARVRQAEAVAAASLGTLAELVGKEQPERRGFRSLAEVQTATLAGFLLVFMVHLDSVSSYRPGQDVHALLIDKQEVMSPLAVGDEVRTSVVVKRRVDGRWEAAEFGHGKLVKAIHAGRRSVYKTRGITEENLALIEIPMLATHLLGHDENGVLMLTPLHDIAGTALHAWDTRDAREVFAMLQPLTVNMDPTLSY